MEGWTYLVDPLYICAFVQALVWPVIRKKVVSFKALLPSQHHFRLMLK